MSLQRLCILGSTGSIGQNTLAIVRASPAQFAIKVLTAYHNSDLLFKQCCEFKPEFAYLADKKRALALGQRLQEHSIATKVLWGEKDLNYLASLEEIDRVVAGIVGAAGLKPTLAAIEAGKIVILANKEPLIMAGDLMLATAQKSGATILPADSEHNAIFQCLADDYRVGLRPKGVQKVILTASGGPFLLTPDTEFSKITPQMACAHPTWQMGPKISVDCATLMNKGLEVIEASHLFQLAENEIEVLIHPQSIVHSFVEFEDNALLAQCGPHDMRVPLSYCLNWPKRGLSGAKSLNLAAISRLDFQLPDTTKFPCLALAYEALKTGGSAPLVLNAANEVAVAAFLADKISFHEIPIIIEKSLESAGHLFEDGIDAIIEIDRQTRRGAMSCQHFSVL